MPENTRVFVFDSHRPLDLENTRGDNRDVLVLRDEREGEEAFPEPDSESDSESDSEGDSEGDSESDADEEKENAPREGNDGEGEDVSAARRKRDVRAKEKESPRAKRARRQQRQLERVAYYSRGSFYGRAAGLVMYDIAHDTHKDSLEKHFPLWLAIVSLTDQYVHQRLSHEAYTAGVMELATQVSNLPNADAPNTRVLDEGRVVRAFEDRRVQYSEEFRFSMLRHWSLYDAMTHSPYVATRLQTWREQGRVSLHSLLAHLGLPLEACKQQFTHMSPEHVARLHEKLEQHAPSHGLDDLKFWSFSFSHGFKTRLVASDVVHGVTALLEGVPEGAQSEVGGAGAFWRAVKALGMSQYDEMQVGLRHAMRSQRALMRQGGLALANKAVIRTVGGLRYFSLLDHGSPADAALFKHPLSLARLALFLQDALRGTKKIERPLVVVGPPVSNGVANDDDGTGTTNAQSSNDASFALVVGVTGAPRADDADGGNHFSQSFRRAAETARARFKHDAFEASVVQVARQNLGEFMEALSDIDAERVARERMHAVA